MPRLTYGPNINKATFSFWKTQQVGAKGAGGGLTAESLKQSMKDIHQKIMDDHQADSLTYALKGIYTLNADMPKKLGVITAMMDDVEAAATPVYFKTLSDQWGTPKKLYNTLEGEFAFTLDAAASWVSAKCEQYLDEEIDALKVNWWGRVFCNPPYSKVGEFIDKAVEEVMAGRVEVAVLLVAARVDTKWWWRACQYAGEIRFLKGRLKFEVYGVQEVDDNEPMQSPSGGVLVQVAQLPGPSEYEPVGPTKYVWELSSAPFPSAVIVIDKRAQQTVTWWDWKQEMTAPYVWHKQKPVTIGDSTPAEVKDLMKTLQATAKQMEDQLIAEKLQAKMQILAQQEANKKAVYTEAQAHAKTLIAKAKVGDLPSLMEIIQKVGGSKGWEQALADEFGVSKEQAKNLLNAAVSNAVTYKESLEKAVKQAALKPKDSMYLGGIKPGDIVNWPPTKSQKVQGKFEFPNDSSVVFGSGKDSLPAADPAAGIPVDPLNPASLFNVFNFDNLDAFDPDGD